MRLKNKLNIKRSDPGNANIYEGYLQQIMADKKCQPLTIRNANIKL